jgi:peptidoglycan hydrolase-like protein with peptidoglycan-binding domain
MDTVKSYLTTLKDKSRTELTSKNSSARIMAVQIALENTGKDVGIIDGLFKTGGTTRKAVQDFQKENNLKADGQPGKDTISKILEKLKNQTETPVSTNPTTSTEQEQQQQEQLQNHYEKLSLIKADILNDKEEIQKVIDVIDRFIKANGQRTIKDLSNGLQLKFEHNGKREW